MRIYIASSWKNIELVASVTAFLRQHGHEVDCFGDTTTGRFSFHFSEIPEFETLDAIGFLNDERSRRAFAEDKKWLDWCEAVVMILPCGKSAHLEAGYAVGQGKKLIIYGVFQTGEFDVMYGFADRLIPMAEADNLLMALRGTDK